MAGRYFGWLAGGLVLAGLLICSAYAAAETDEQEAKVNEQMLAAAKETLKATQAAYERGREISVEDLYRWSRRVIEADNFSNRAVKDHVALMQDLHDRTVAKSKVGAPGGMPHIVHATEYYLAEAESLAR